VALNSATRRAVLSAVKLPRIQQVANMGAVSKIGNREVVGFGYNGDKNYVDRIDFPMPAIRFKENTPDVQALHEKATGDWKKLSIEEKKALYRASFAQTFSEMKAPTGEWKSVLGMTLIISSLSVWIYMAMKTFVYFPMPNTFEPERQNAQLERMIALKANPVQGPSAHWDYEKNDWKQ
jgi:cytochrome c oxidase subunit 4